MLKKLTAGIEALLERPKLIFVIYIIVNLVPSILLVTSEPLNFAGKMVLFLAPLGLYLCIYSLSQKTGLIQVLLIPLLVLHAFQLVLFYMYGENVIAADMFLNVVTTNPSEAGELLVSIWPSVLGVCVLYIPIIVLSIMQLRRKICLSRNFRRCTFIMGLGIFIAAYGISIFAHNKNTQVFSYHQNIYPNNVLYNLDFAINKWKRIDRYHTTSKDFTFEATRTPNTDKREIYVMVVGETGRAGNWSLYGYERQTNPRLAKDSNLVFYRDAITQSNTTHKSVPIILSAASAENFDIIYEQKSIIHAFKECGFTTVFISNQSPNRSFTELFSEEADIYKTFRDELATNNAPDGVMLPYLKNCIDSIDGNLFIVLHSYGSHFNYRERYTDEFSVFKPDAVKGMTLKERDVLINAYDNSILYADYFLDGVIQLLRNEDASSGMFYCADHGEDIFDDDRHRFLHASPIPTYYQLRIPMLMWFSDSYIDANPRKFSMAKRNMTMPVSTNSAFHTMLDMANIKTNYFEVDLSLLRAAFRPQERMYLDDHDDPVSFYELNLKEEDREMIEKNNIYH